MTDESPQKDHIQVAVRNGVGFARVIGRGSFKVSASVKEYGTALLNSGVKRLVIDLQDCVGMDSTFMGVTAGLCNRFHREGNAKVEMVNCSEKIKRLMTTLGLDRLVDVVSGDSAEGTVPENGELEELEAKAESPLESAETMLEAHENLVKVHSDNEMRFQDVLDYLREDIQRQRRS
ncbi:MAG: STAS domain-containing protein [Verrucomicrobia bacterium]|nr:STAS domain-containing protein [Verrucomicrobiota bacterium]MCH8514285.1 STAS domain-containing protein [Kiritimatiellia bacterium]